MQPVLETHNIETFYGPIQALKGVNIQIIPGGITTIIGANGAGKSTILKTISGALYPQKGTVLWQGREIQGQPPNRVARHGIAHVPEGREVFPLLTVRENLILGGYQFKRPEEHLHWVLDEFPILKDKLSKSAGLLSGGEQQMLALGRALMQSPQLLLLDEPSLGLAPRLTHEIFDVLKKINRERQLTMVLVEQNARLAIETCSHGYVLELGRIVFEGDQESLLGNKDIQEFYLGGRDEGLRGRRRWKRKKSWS